MNVCEKLRQLAVNIIAIDIVAFESMCAITVSQEELLRLYQKSGKDIEDIANKFFVEMETAQHWIYLPPTHRHGLKEPRRSEVVRYLKQ
jgi:hypothetical protein